MILIRFSADGNEALDIICGRWAPMMRASRREKISRVIAWLMRDRNLEIADKGLVIEAAKFVVSGGHTPFFDMMEDIDKFHEINRKPYIDDDAYYKMPRFVRRWHHILIPTQKPPEDIKILAFNASPRLNGNTQALIDEAIKGAQHAGVKKIEQILLQKIKLGFCVGCRNCKTAGAEPICSVQDDMKSIYPKILDSDVIIIGFPVYTGRECAQLSTFLDRLDCFEGFIFGKKLKPGRRAMVIGTWGYPKISTYDHIVENVMTVINLHQIVPVEAFSACGFAAKYKGLDKNKKAIIRHFPEELKKAYEAGYTLVTGKELTN